MKKLVVFIFVCCSMAAYASTTKKLSFSRMLVKLETISVNGESRVRVGYQDLSNVGVVDKPSIPSKQLFFSVPSDAKDFSISCKATEDIDIALTSPIMYNTADVAGVIGEINPPSHILPYYPESMANIDHVGLMGGTHKVVAVTVYPLSVGMGDKSVILHQNMEITLDWATGDGDEGLVSAMTRNLNAQAETNRLLSRYTFDYIDQSGEMVSPFSTDQEDYDYIIIAPDKLCAALERLAAIRRTKGFGARVFPLEQILKLPIVANGDEVSCINNDAGKLRAFIRYAYQNFGTRYVLLAGTSEDVPIAFARVYSSGNCFQEVWVPSDLYFSDMTGKWMQYTDEQKPLTPFVYDFFGEVHVGRLEFADTEDVDNYIDKLALYEFNPGLGDTEYLNKTLLTWQDKDDVISQITDVHLKSYKQLYEGNIIDVAESQSLSGQTTTGAMAINTWNDNPTGVQNFIGHGNPGGIAVGTYGPKRYYGIVAKDNEDCHHIKEFGNGLDCLRNKNYPGWAFSIGCHTMPFDKKDDENNIYDNMTFGTSYTLGNGYGGVAFFGNTRSALVNDGGQWMRKLFDHITGEYSDKENVCGVYAGQVMSYLRAFSGTTSHQRMMLNLYGDPLVNLWVSAPSKINVIEKQDVTSGAYSYDVSGRDKLMLAAMPLTDATYARKDVLEDNERNGLSLECNKLYTITGKNSLPYILPLRIQNFDFAQHATFNIFADKVFVGTSVDPMCEKGNVTVANGVELNIESLSEVNLYDGFEIKNGATVYISAKNCVNLGKIKLGQNSTLHVKAAKINYNENELDLSDGSSQIIIEGENGIKVLHGTGISEKRAPDLYDSMVVPGRTWWYTSSPGAYSDLIAETGISIGGEIGINGKTYNKVYVKYFAIETTPYEYKNIEQYNEDEGILGYMRDDKGVIYYMDAKKTDKIHKSFYLSNVIENEFFEKLSPDDECHGERVLYNFTEEGKKYTYFFRITVLTQQCDKPIENSGHEFNVYKYAVEAYFYGEPYFGEVIDCIGETTMQTNFGKSKLFCYPFMPQGHSHANPQFDRLRYVTDGDDNEVLFEGHGGLRLWENLKGDETSKPSDAEGVDDVTADAENSGEQWYDMYGRQIHRVEKPGVYVRVVNGKASKHMIK